MSKIRDHVSDVPARTRIAANRVRVGASNAWHRAAGNRIRGARTGLSNRRNQRTLERGRAPRLTGARAAISSRLPVYRNRINPAHGNPHREDARLHRLGNGGLGRAKESRQREARAAAGALTRSHAAIVAMRNNALVPHPARDVPQRHTQEQCRSDEMLARTRTAHSRRRSTR